MDVVRRNVEELQGNVQVKSLEGQGSTMTVRLPLTLAILDGLLVQVTNEVYVIPLLSVVESISIEPKDIRELVSAGQVIMLRGEVVPVVWLSKLLQGADDNHGQTKRLLVIVEDQGQVWPGSRRTDWPASKWLSRISKPTSARCQAWLGDNSRRWMCRADSRYGRHCGPAHRTQTEYGVILDHRRK